MNDAAAQSEPRADVIDALRRLAAGGVSLRPLVQEICSRLGHEKPLVLPVLWYFTRAFHLSLRQALPLREWIGSEEDNSEINSITLPAIEQTRDRWMAELTPPYNGTGSVALAELDAAAREHRS